MSSEALTACSSSIPTVPRLLPTSAASISSPGGAGHPRCAYFRWHTPSARLGGASKRQLGRINPALRRRGGGRRLAAHFPKCGPSLAAPRLLLFQRRWQSQRQPPRHVPALNLRLQRKTLERLQFSRHSPGHQRRLQIEARRLLRPLLRLCRRRRSHQKNLPQQLQRRPRLLRTKLPLLAATEPLRCVRPFYSLFTTHYSLLFPPRTR